MNTYMVQADIQISVEFKLTRTINSSVAYFSKLQSSLLSLPIREFKKLRLLLQQKRHFKIKLCFKLTVPRLFHVDHTSYKIGEAHFRLLGTNGFLVKAKNERFTAMP